MSSALIHLAHHLGNHPKKLALWTEGSVAMKCQEGKMYTNTAGSTLATLKEEDVVEMNLAKLQEIVTCAELDPNQMQAAKSFPSQPNPTINALLFAELLGFDGINFVAHTQPSPINQITASPRARQFSDRRHLPHEVFATGQASVMVPLVPLGLPLAKEMKKRIALWKDRYREVPKIILIQSHGMIALGNTPEDVIKITEMATKCAEVFIGASLLGGPEFLKPLLVAQIDENKEIWA